MTPRFGGARPLYAWRGQLGYAEIPICAGRTLRHVPAAFWGYKKFGYAEFDRASRVVYLASRGRWHKSIRQRARCHSSEVWLRGLVVVLVGRREF